MVQVYPEFYNSTYTLRSSVINHNESLGGSSLLLDRMCFCMTRFLRLKTMTL